MKTEILSNLKKLKLEDMLAVEEFSWIDGEQFFPFLRELTLYNCPKLMRLPPLATSLVKLDLWRVGLVEPPAFWQGLRDQNGSISSMIASLELLEIGECPHLKDLQRLFSHSLPSLNFVKIHRCQELEQLPLEAFKEFTSLEKISVWNCPKLRLMQDEGRNLFLPSSIKELWLSNCGDLEKLLAGGIDNLISLTELTVGYCPSLFSDLPSEAAQMTELGKLIVTYCGELKLNELGVRNSLAEVAFLGPPKLVLKGENLLSLCKLEINSTALLKLLPLRNTLPTIKALVISYSSQVSMFEGNEHELLLSLVALDSLRFYHCEKLQTLPTELHSILSLEDLAIYYCPQIKSLPEKGLPASLKFIDCIGCHLMLRKMVDKYNEQKSNEVVHERTQLDRLLKQRSTMNFRKIHEGIPLHRNLSGGRSKTSVLNRLLKTVRLRNPNWTVKAVSAGRRLLSAKRYLRRSRAIELTISEINQAEGLDIPGNEV